MAETYKYLVDALVKERGLCADFAEEVSAEASRAVREAGSKGEGGRKDYRDLPFVTIDDDTARDFDDAVFCRKNGGGGVSLLVAIADVAGYVVPGGELDREARARGNSVYLPDRVLPMLPAALSENACSLRPGEDRLCLTCEMEVADGEVREYRFRRGIMRSQRRLNYETAAKQMSEGGELALFRKLTGDFRKRRRESGGLMIERPEMKLRLRAETLTSEECHRNIAHWAIEECMIAANRCAADFLVRRRLPALHRVHKRPEEAGVRKLASVLRRLAIPFPDRPQAADFGGALDLAESRAPQLAAALTPVILGALGRAVYSPEGDAGHYGLACSRYTHFTSPIRRYPDLLTHRALLAAIGEGEGGSGGGNGAGMNDLRADGEHCSQTEHIADKMEWNIRQRLFCLRARAFLGGECDAFVAGATEFGLFVCAPDFQLEGMVPFSRLPGYWRYEAAAQSLTSRSGKTLSLGDALTVRLESVSPQKGKANFSPIELPN